MTTTFLLKKDCNISKWGSEPSGCSWSYEINDHIQAGFAQDRIASVIRVRFPGVSEADIDSIPYTKTNRICLQLILMFKLRSIPHSLDWRAECTMGHHCLVASLDGSRTRQFIRLFLEGVRKELPWLSRDDFRRIESGLGF
jgi:hypothetical protein